MANTTQATQQHLICSECGAAVEEKVAFCESCAIAQYKQRPEGERRLWNPSAAGWWSLMFSSLFGAILLDKNWRMLGQYQKAKKTRHLLWGTVLLFGIAIVSALYTNSPASEKLVGELVKICGMGLTAICVSVGRSQNQFLIDSEITEYPKRSWTKPIVIGATGFAFVVALIILPSLVPTGPSLVELESESQRIMQLEFKERPDLAGATIKKIHINRQNGQDYYGVADILYADKDLHLPLHVRLNGNQLTWQLSNP